MISSSSKVQVFKGADGQWYWHVRARNGKITEAGGEGYVRKGNALRAVKRRFSGSQIMPLEVLHSAAP